MASITARANHNKSSPISSRSPELRRGSYSPISPPKELNESQQTASGRPASDGSSDLSDVEEDDIDELIGEKEIDEAIEQIQGPSLPSSLAGSMSDSDDVGADSANESEVETERLHISPQKARDQAIEDGDEDDGEEEDDQDGQQEATNDTPAIALPGLRPQDILGDEREEDVHSSDSDTSMRDQDASPTTLAGHKRKRNGQLSPMNDLLSPDESSPRKRSIRRSFGLQAPPPPASDAEIEAAADAAVSSSDDEENAIRKIESARRGSLTPVPDQEEDVPLEEPATEADAEADAEPAEEEEAVEEADNEEDEEAEAAPKTEDELIRKKQAYDQFKPLEKLFAIFRDRVFNEKWAEHTTELEQLNAPDTTHAEFLAMRQAVDARRDEKHRLEQISLQYKIKNLEKRTLATRAQLHCRHYQKLRGIRDDHLTQLNEDYCQIQRERRHFVRKEPHFVYSFESDRNKQIENQRRYNKEVSILSGIARYKGFPGAPKLNAAPKDDIEGDFRAMRTQDESATNTNTRALSYSQLARSARASEAAAGDQFLNDTPWANPNHPLNRRAPVMEANTPINVATPPPPSQAWMLGGSVPSSEARPLPQHVHGSYDPLARRPPSGSGQHYPPSQQHLHHSNSNGHNGHPHNPTAATSSPFESLKRQQSSTHSHALAGQEIGPTATTTSWRDNVQAHLASRLSHNNTPNARVDKSPFETRATRTSASFPIAPGTGGPAMVREGSGIGSQLANTGPGVPRAGAFGTPGVEPREVPGEGQGRVEYGRLVGGGGMRA